MKAKYRKRPVVIEAEQWFPGHPVEGVTECKGVEAHFGRITTLEGDHIVTPGDFIITGVVGEKYPCKPHIFAMTYEPVEDELEAKSAEDSRS